MHRRATSKKRAAEAEKELDMDDKEATSVEDIEVVLPPAEQKQPAQRKEQQEKPTQTGDANLLEMMLEETLKRDVYKRQLDQHTKKPLS